MRGGQNDRILLAVDRSYSAFWQAIMPPAEQLEYCERCGNAAAELNDDLHCQECVEELRDRASHRAEHQRDNRECIL